MIYGAWEAGLPPRDERARPASTMRRRIELVERMWREPDEGIWEIRGQRQHFTYSKVSAWTAVDRAIKLAEATGEDAPARALARRCATPSTPRSWPTATTPSATPSSSTTAGTDSTRACCSSRSFGFLPADDPRVLGTIDAIQREICEGPFVWRYSTEDGVDGLAGGEGAFLICSFWLVSALADAGRVEEAERHLEQLMALQNDVGLLSEEYDPDEQTPARQLPAGLLAHRPAAVHHCGLRCATDAWMTGQFH